MDEHNDDLEPEVDEGDEFETEEFPLLDEEDADEPDDADAEAEEEIDPSEL